MSLRLRVALTVFVSVAVAMLLAFAVLSHVVFSPVGKEFHRLHLEHLFLLSEKLDAGIPPSALEERFGMSVRPVPERRFGKRRRRHCRVFTRGDRQVEHCRGGPKRPARIKTASGVYEVRRHFNPEGLRRDIVLALLALTLLVGAIAFWLAKRVLGPLETTRDAMRRIAEGDLSHRLNPKEGQRELRALAEVFNAMAARVESLLATEKELMAGMSHELRTPLARLRLHLELLRDSGASPDRLDAAETELEELDRVMDALFKISKMSLGVATADFGEFTVRTVVDEAIKGAGVDPSCIELRIEQERMFGHRVLVTRALRNLLENARRYGPDGGRITVHAGGDCFEVRDQGQAFSGDAESLFKPFVRGESQKAGEGLGLGLTFVQRVALLHGGSARAQVGDGFSVRLCLRS